MLAVSRLMFLSLGLAAAPAPEKAVQTQATPDKAVEKMAAPVVAGAKPAAVAANGGCRFPLAMVHSGRPEISGGFDLGSTSYAGKGAPAPAIRFWAFGHYETMNSGSQEQFRPRLEWLINPGVDRGIKGWPSDVYRLFQTNWFGGQVRGCVVDLPTDQRRTVIELAFADPGREKSNMHQGYYAVISVRNRADAPTFNFDQVTGAGGPKGNVVKALPIPAPIQVGKPTPLAGGMVQVNLQLPEAVSYSEEGKDKPVALIKGYRVLYATGDEPTTSDPSAYKPALDPKRTDATLDFVPAGKSAIAVPAGGKTWLVAQLVYNDPTSVVSPATSAHIALSADGGTPPTPAVPTGGRKRGR